VDEADKSGWEIFDYLDTFRRNVPLVYTEPLLPETLSRPMQEYGGASHIRVCSSDLI
jgi:hypothetical protein